jgi:hypothetical protein
MHIAKSSNHLPQMYLLFRKYGNSLLAFPAAIEKEYSALLQDQAGESSFLVEASSSLLMFGCC